LHLRSLSIRRNYYTDYSLFHIIFATTARTRRRISFVRVARDVDQGIATPPSRRIINHLTRNDGNAYLINLFNSEIKKKRLVVKNLDYIIRNSQFYCFKL
jgi:hypothetical protein